MVLPAMGFTGMELSAQGGNQLHKKSRNLFRPFKNDFIPNY
jgi:hypothetical protein